MDPVTLGLCSQIDLDLEVHRAAKEKPVDAAAQGATLLPASETTIRPREPEPAEKKPSRGARRRAVFAKLKQIGGARAASSEEKRRALPRERDPNRSRLCFIARCPFELLDRRAPIRRGYFRRSSASRLKRPAAVTNSNSWPPMIETFFQNWVCCAR